MHAATMRDRLSFPAKVLARMAPMLSTDVTPSSAPENELTLLRHAVGQHQGMQHGMSMIVGCVWV
jgi:hypothetical protein